MCHLSMKLSDKFDPNQMYTSDKSLTLSPRAKVIANNRILSKGNIPPLNKQTRLCFVTVV